MGRQLAGVIENEGACALLLEIAKTNKKGAAPWAILSAFPVFCQGTFGSITNPVGFHVADKTIKSSSIPQVAVTRYSGDTFSAIST